jgi:hypothetical protein
MVDSQDNHSHHMTMTNVLSFEVGKDPERRAIVAPTETFVTPRIDGVSLATLAEQFERSRGLIDPAGGYDGLNVDYFEWGPLDRYFLGKSEDPYFARTPGRVYVLGCQCGELGCWPLACSIETADGKITWHSFENPHRPKRDYSSFGPFVFDLAQYEEALRSLPSKPVLSK